MAVIVHDGGRMVAPAGVNEGVPQEPVKTGAPHVGLAAAQAVEGEQAEGEPTEVKPIGTVPAEARPAGTVPPPAEPPDGELVAGPRRERPEAGPTEGVRGKAELAEADDAAARPAEGEHAAAEPAEGEHAAAEPAEAEQAGAEQAGAEHTAAESAEGARAEAELAEAGWDAEDESRDVGPLAVAGIILGVIALVGVAVGVLAIVTHGFRPKTVITYQPAAVFGLRPGECINSAANALNVTVMSCAAPHDAEVFATFSLPGGAWPGDSSVQLDASDGCVNRFDSYLNPQLASADLTQEYVYPNQAAWQAGERTVVCEVRAASGQLTGSVRATS
jgi:hypothetical protein